MKHLVSKYRLIMIAFVFALGLASCNKEDSIETDDVEAVEDNATDKAIQDDGFITKYFMGSEVKVKLQEDGIYSLGGSDMLVFEEQLTDSAEAYYVNPVPDDGTTKLATSSGLTKWSNNTVVYTTSGLSSEVRSELQKAFNEWSSKTNIRFKERTDESTYVTISSSGEDKDSASATIGANGDKGIIKLGLKAKKRIMVHEIGHTLGYIHEHQRADRDEYIIINEDNIIDEKKDAFVKISSASSVNASLDVNSVMIYSSSAFSKNGLSTITEIDGTLISLPQGKLSKGDIVATRVVYPKRRNLSSCSDTGIWSPNARYVLGARVIFKGNLFERGVSGWTFIKNCS